MNDLHGFQPTSSEIGDDNTMGFTLHYIGRLASWGLGVFLAIATVFVGW